MLKYTDYDIVFQEVPDEVSLAVNLSNCPHRCPGCHSQQLWNDIGDELNEGSLGALIDKYSKSITCVCFMGGDCDLVMLQQLASYVHTRGFKVAWYTGASALPVGVDTRLFNYIKIGPYIEHLGALRSKETNQRYYRVSDGALEDITSVFWKK